jgi:hypothetical protein
MLVLNCLGTRVLSVAFRSSKKRRSVIKRTLKPCAPLAGGCPTQTSSFNTQSIYANGVLSSSAASPLYLDPQSGVQAKVTVLGVNAAQFTMEDVQVRAHKLCSAALEKQKDLGVFRSPFAAALRHLW